MTDQISTLDKITRHIIDQQLETVYEWDVAAVGGHTAVEFPFAPPSADEPGRQSLLSVVALPPFDEAISTERVKANGRPIPQNGDEDGWGSAEMEYVAACLLLRDWFRRELGPSDILQEIETLLREYDSLAPILGVFLKLAPMLKEELGWSLWPLLMGLGGGWPGRILAALRRLLRDRREAGAYGALAEMLVEGDTHVQEQVLDTLKVRTIASRAPADLMAAAGALANHPRVSIRRRAALALGGASHVDLALPVLALAVGDAHHSVRRNAVVSLRRLGDARAVPALLSALEDPNDKVRRRAVEALGELGDEQAVEPLVTALKDGNEFVRQAAAQSLGRLGDRGAVVPLISAMTDYYRNVRWGAVEALGALGDRRAVGALTGALLDGDAGVRQRAVLALGQYGQPAAARLSAALLDSNAAVRLAAAETLERLGKPSIELLLIALQDADARVRVRAAQTLGQMGNGRAARPLVDALKDKEPPVRKAADQALGLLGDAAVEPLLLALEEPDLAARRAALRALGRIWRLPDVVRLGSADERMRWEASAALGQLGEARAVPALSALLQDQNAAVRAAAAEGLGKLGDARGTIPLIAALEDNDAGARGAGARALGLIGDARAIKPLIDALNDGELRVRRAVTEALTRIGEPVVESLILALQDKRGAVKRTAAQLLASLGDDRAVEPLIAALQNGDEIVRWEALRGLKRIGTVDALTAVRQYEGGMRRRAGRKSLFAKMLAP